MTGARWGKGEWMQQISGREQFTVKHGGMRARGVLGDRVKV